MPIRRRRHRARLEEYLRTAPPLLHDVHVPLRREPVRREPVAERVSLGAEAAERLRVALSLPTLPMLPAARVVSEPGTAVAREAAELVQTLRGLEEAVAHLREGITPAR